MSKKFFVSDSGNLKSFENEDVSERYLAYRVVDGVARDGPEDWMELSAECFEVSSARTAHLGCIGLHKIYRTA